MVYIQTRIDPVLIIYKTDMICKIVPIAFVCIHNNLSKYNFNDVTVFRKSYGRF